MDLPDDLILSPEDEVTLRQHLLLVALAKRPADLAIEVGRLLSVPALAATAGTLALGLFRLQP